MIPRRIILCFIFVGSLVAGCATAPKLTHEQALAQSVQLSDLESRLSSARSAGINYLSPENFKKAQALYVTALKEAMSHDMESANQGAGKGLALLDQADASAQQSREIFRDVLITRDRAISAAAPKLYPDKFDDMELRNISMQP